MTLHEVIHGVAFAQAFNFFMQQRRLIPPGAMADEYNGRIAFAQDIEAAQEYAHAQADLAWVRYQTVSSSANPLLFEWTDDTTSTYSGREIADESAAQRATTRPAWVSAPKPL